MLTFYVGSFRGGRERYKKDVLFLCKSIQLIQVEKTILTMIIRQRNVEYKKNRKKLLCFFSHSQALYHAHIMIENSFSCHVYLIQIQFWFYQICFSSVQDTSQYKQRVDFCFTHKKIFSFPIEEGIYWINHITIHKNYYSYQRAGRCAIPSSEIGCQTSVSGKEIFSERIQLSPASLQEISKSIGLHFYGQRCLLMVYSFIRRSNN